MEKNEFVTLLLGALEDERIKKIIKNLNLEVKEYSEEIGDLENPIKDEGSDAVLNKDEKKEEPDKMLELEKKYKAKKNELDFKEIKVERLNEENKELKEEMGILKEKIEEFLIKIGLKEDENKRLQQNIQGLEEEKEGITNRANTLVMERDTLINNEKFLREERKELEGKNQGLVRDLRSINSEKDNVTRELEGYRKQFSTTIEVYNRYQDLSPRTRNSLAGIFKDESLMGLIACGIQGENIESLWDYIKDELKEERLDDMTDLVYIFEHLFNLYKLSNPRYEWQDVIEGKSFDTEYYIRHSSGSVSGRVAEVMFKGYVNKKNGKIIKKSLVKVG